MRTIYVLSLFWCYQIASLFFVVKYRWLGIVRKKEKQKAYLHKVSTRWARHMIKSSGSKIEVIGVENIPDTNVLYVSNHQGYMDIPLLMEYLPKPKGFVAKVELKKVPIVRGWMTRIGCIFLDRSSLRQSMKVIFEGIEKLKHGETLVIFPEGTRSKSDTVGEFKKGSLQLAVKSGVPVVPVTIDGSYKVYEKNNNKIVPADIKITVHKPIYMDNLTIEEKKNLAEIVRIQIQGAIDIEYTF